MKIFVPGKCWLRRISRDMIGTFSPIFIFTFHISRYQRNWGFFGFESSQKGSLKILETPTVGIVPESAISGHFTADPTFSTEIKICVVSKLSQLGGCQQFWSRVLVTAISRVKKHLALELPSLRRLRGETAQQLGKATDGC